MTEPELVLATANPSKVAELRQLLSGHYVVHPRPQSLAETIEDGETLEANAEKKAREVAEVARQAALADDTGLFVRALDGKPGVRSARYAGESASDQDNVAKLLAELPTNETRAAFFRTVIALVGPDRSVVFAAGEVHGTITLEPRGEAGFGYDCVFQPTEGDGRTFAEMSSEEKNRISHRARALKELMGLLS